MNYKENNIKELFNYFYQFVNDIIYDIHSSYIVSRELYKCLYINLNNNSIVKYPLTFCLGGGGYVLYKKIFENEGLNYNLNLPTYDYDISFCFENKINKNNIIIINNEIKNICENKLKSFKFMNLTNKIFSFESDIRNDRLHCRINCDTKLNDEFHILELSFWLNGKVSDNFTVNNFNNIKLLLYEKNDIYYYLLPLDILVKTTLYAIVDFFEKRNFNKCNKYLYRVEYIKKINDLYMKTPNPSNILLTILETYKKQIKRKYKMIHDYPYLLSKEFVKSKYKYKDTKDNKFKTNNGITKCVYSQASLDVYA